MQLLIINYINTLYNYIIIPIYIIIFTPSMSIPFLLRVNEGAR